MSLARSIAAEFAHEAATTRRLLERVPEEHLNWKPHERSMTLARLVGHIAEIPGWSSAILDRDEFDMAQAGDYKPVVPENRAELLEVFDRHVAAFQEAVEKQADSHLMVTWRFRQGDEVLVELPRVAAIRSFVLSHTIHHRGQLSVYLRLRNVGLPPIYGPTADEIGQFG
jgi:uncharacterized damage-inducible protein DinB